MAGSSSKIPIPIFTGQNFRNWSEIMRKHFSRKGLWYVVEEGYQKPEIMAMLDAKETKELKSDMLNDAKALSLIQKYVSSKIFKRIVEAKTAKEAWETLQAIFQMSDDDESQSESENEWSDDLDIEYEEEAVMPLSGEKPFFDIMLTKCAVQHPFHLNFPRRVETILPSTNVQAKVQFFGRKFNVFFYGNRKQKAFGSGWRLLVRKYNLLEGDFLIFEILESSDSTLEISMQVLRSTLRGKDREELKERKGQSSTSGIHIDDSSSEPTRGKKKK